MIVKKIKTFVKCEVSGCTNTAEYLVKKGEKSYDGDGLMLCQECAKSIADFIRNKNKENKSAKQNG